jgi:ABC-2 type transport system ATP-binding protein
MEINIKRMMFKQNIVFENTSISINQNGCYALLGRNGTGKTTLMKIMTGMINDYDGSVVFNPDEKLASLVDGFGFIEYYSGNDMAELLLTEKELGNFKKLADEFSASSFIDNKISSYSLGMKRKFAICFVFSINANILLLDEPYNGLDTAAKNQLSAIINRTKKDKKIIVSTHIFDNLSEFADKIIVIKDKMIKMACPKENAYRIVFKNKADAMEFASSCEILHKLSENVVNVYGSNSKDIEVIRPKAFKYEINEFAKIEFEFDAEGKND